MTTKTKRNAKKVIDGGVEKKLVSQKSKSSTNPPLPLYHPLGRLALSLPDLDPATIGLTLPTYTQDDARRSSGRTRRPAAKLREVDDEAETLPIIASALTEEAKDKASPKKKGGARPSAGLKRKRKDPDEDATYPAKKTTTRQPKGAPQSSRFPTSPPDTNQPLPSALEITAAAQEEKRPERRSTRSARGSLLRRDSSASEATATSVSISIATVNGKRKSPHGMLSRSPEAEKPDSEDHDKGADMVDESSK